MVRKLAMAAVPVFIRPQPTGSLQALLGEIVLVAYIAVIAYLRPFAASDDNLLQVGSMIGMLTLRSFRARDSCLGSCRGLLTSTCFKMS